jgi:4-hydroxyacetophenone monooxygenase
VTPDDSGPQTAAADRAMLRSAIEEADIPVLLMVLVHLTGDRRWIEAPFQPVRDTRLFPDESGGLSPELQAEVRKAAVQAILEGPVSAEEPSVELLTEMMSVAVGEPVAEEYVPLMLEEMGLRTPPLPWRGASPEHAARVLVVGAGVSGICAAIQARAAGFEATVLERNPNLGGTWWENTYPECGVDTPNHFYSFSFAPNRDWSSYFSKQPEILEYLSRCAADAGITESIRFDTSVRTVRWDDRRGVWSAECERAGESATFEAEFLFMAVGQLNRPSVPDIVGAEDFAGPAFHTAHWRHDVDLHDRRVGIIGTGASAIQAARTIAEQASELTIFQRSPQWVAPNPDYHRSVSDAKKYLLNHVDFYAAWYRFVLFWRFGDGLHASLHVDPEWPHLDRSLNVANERHRRFLTGYIEQQLEGRPDLLEKCLPDYPPYGKRMLMDNEWFKVLRRDDVHLVTEPIERITDGGVVTGGTQHDLDVLVYGTGFHTTRPVWPIEVVGRDGSTLDDLWGPEDPRAYLGITVPNFPNMFLLFGPNTALGHGGSIIFHAECQVRYAVRCMTATLESSAQAIEVLPDAFDDYGREVDERLARMVWSHPGMDNWYKNSKGRVVTNSPWRLIDYWKMTREPEAADYRLVGPDGVSVEMAIDDSSSTSSPNRG